MTQRATEVTKDQLVQEFGSVVADTEQLLKSVVHAGGEKVGTLRSGIEQNLAKAKDRLLDYQQAASDRSRAAARATDRYVHVHPWQALGIAAGVSIVAGALLALLLGRR